MAEAGGGEGGDTTRAGPASDPPRPPLESGRPRDYARELNEEIAKGAADQQPRSERDTARAIERRWELYVSAYLDAKRPALQTIPQEVDADERIARLSAELRKRDIEVVPPQAQRQWAELDAQDFRRLQDPHRQETAAGDMADTARGNATYRTTLANQAPDVYERITAAQVRYDARLKEESDREPEEFVPMTGVNAVPAEARVASNDQVVRSSDAANDPARGRETMSIDPATFERLAAARARDSKQAADELQLNSLERDVQAKVGATSIDSTVPAGQQGRDDANAVEHVAESSSIVSSARGENQVASDEALTVTQAEPVIPPEVKARYLRVGNKFYHPKNTELVAFEDKGSRLETRSNSEQIANTMVTIARSRGWEDIKVSGTETFRKEVWLEAAAHGMHVRGYTPSEFDKAELAKRAQTVEANRVEPAAARSPSRQNESASPADSETHQRARTFAEKSAAEAVRAHPELAGSVAIASAIEKRVVADGLSSAQKAIVAARVRENLVNSIERGDLPEAKVRDRVDTTRETTRDWDYSR